MIQTDLPTDPKIPLSFADVRLLLPPRCSDRSAWMQNHGITFGDAIPRTMDRFREQFTTCARCGVDGQFAHDSTKNKLVMIELKQEVDPEGFDALWATLLRGH